MNLAHTPNEVVSTLDSLERLITVLAFVGGFGLLLVLGDLIVSAADWFHDRKVDHLAEMLRSRPDPVLSLFDVDPAGRIEPVYWTWNEDGDLVEYVVPKA